MGLCARRVASEVNRFPARQGAFPPICEVAVKKLPVACVLGVALGLWVIFLACGPVESTHLILQADTTKTAEADKKSPYEFTAAEQYLHKAREKWGTSDFEYSIDYARKSKTLGEKAKERSLKPEEER